MCQVVSSQELHLLHIVANGNSLLHVGKGADVHRWLWQSAVHPRQTEEGEQGVDHTHHEEVPVVARSFLQSLR